MNDEVTQDTSHEPSQETVVDRVTGRLSALCGQVLDDRYQVDELIGMGAMGAVFRARQLRLRRTVAIKVPKPELAKNRDFLGRFEREALSMAKVVHENIVQIFDVYVSSEEEIPSFIAMEFVEGVELERFLIEQQDQLTVSAVLELFAQIARGLDAAHDRGIIHRDIKPSNIVITMPQRVAKIMDFGIAHVEMEDVFATKEASSIGTPAYMAPEQVRGSQVTGAADIYAFGMTIYRLLTRKLAFDVSGGTSLLYAHMNKPPIPLYERNRRLPLAAWDALRPALEKRPESRPARAAALVEELRKALQPILNRSYSDLFHGPEEPLIAVTAFESVVGQARYHKRLAGYSLALTTVVLIIAFAGALFYGGGGDEEPSGGEATAEAKDAPEAVEVAQAALPAAAEVEEKSKPEISHPMPPALPEPSPTPDPTPGPKERPAPEPGPSPRPTPEPTPRPSPTPVATEPPALADIDAVPPEPTPIPRSPEYWDPGATIPMEPGPDQRRIQRTLTLYLDQEIERPLRSAELLDNPLAGLGGEAASIILRAAQQYRQSYRSLIISFTVLDSSIYWGDHALLYMDMVIWGRPPRIDDPTYRETLFRTEVPIYGFFELEGESWKVVDLQGDLSALANKLEESKE